MGPEGIHRKTHSSIVEIGVARIKTTVTDKNSDIDCLVKTFLSNDKNMKKIIVSSLFNFLNLPDFTFVGIGIQNTLRKLESEFGLTCKNAVEVGPGTWNQHLAVQKRLIRDIVSTQKPSSPIFDDWGNYLLNKDQIQLAAWNAHFAFRIGNLLLDALDYYP
ncbi:hypothetical protein Bca52824_082660 [Brassica carinata]|uniref:Uncharacterized protein n=1 Tax=Brassica carinata TaxID=52824 RepID=A0A8X7TST8_BRACI|nr:hypothetical protein Bca52824_082660 [Brassica carinata]